MGTRIEGTIPTRAQDDAKALPITKRPRRRFVYWHPSRRGWTWGGDLGWLPRLRTLYALPGALGVPMSGSTIAPETVLRAQGHTVLDPHDRRLPDEHRPYYRIYRTLLRVGPAQAAVHEAYLPTGAVVSRGSDRALVVRADPESYARLLVALRDRGIVPPMPFEALEDELRRLDKERRRLAKDVRLNPRAEDRYNEIPEIQAAMRQDWERRWGETESPVQALTPTAEDPQDTVSDEGEVLVPLDPEPEPVKIPVKKSKK